MNGPRAKNDEKSYLLVGDGAELCYNFFLEKEINCILAPENLNLQSAYCVAMAAMHTEPMISDDIEPQYLRLSQAERERLEREKQIQ